jgi:hypothetical protein
MYERTHGAFVHGALLGVLVGTDVLSGPWHLAARTAHLHVNLLGWGGLTLLATMVFFGPAIARTPMEKEAGPRAARALRWGASGLAAAVLALLGEGFGGVAGTALGVAASAGLAIYARAVTVVCMPVLRAAWRERPSMGRWSILATAAWFPVVAWGDVVAVAAGADRLLEAVGVGMLVGVLAQSILATLGHFAHLLWSPDPSRDAARNRLTRLAGARAAAWNAGVVLAALAAALGPSAGEAGAWLARAGWALLVVVTWGQVLLIVAGPRATVRP